MGGLPMHFHRNGRTFFIYRCATLTLPLPNIKVAVVQQQPYWCPAVNNFIGAAKRNRLYGRCGWGALYQGISHLMADISGHGLLYTASASNTQRYNRLSLVGGHWQMEKEELGYIKAGSINSHIDIPLIVVPSLFPLTRLYQASFAACFGHIAT